MSREIKFRAWDYDNECMYDDSQIIIHGGTVFIGKIKYVNQISQDTELMQYTGLKDQNGKEIYEGDVVRWGMNGQECWNRYAVVELFHCLQFRIIFYVEEKTNIKKPTDNYIFGYSNFMYKETSKYLEVIGNIYENPELLA